MDNTSHSVAVSGFSDEMKPVKGIPVGPCGTVWTDHEGVESLLVFNEALYFGDRMSHSLLCPNQMRSHGVLVDDIPRQFSPESSHSIQIPEGPLIPLTIRGVVSGFQSYPPTAAQLHTLPRYDMTSSAPWDPHSKDLAKAEEKYPLAKTATVAAASKVTQAPSLGTTFARIDHSAANLSRVVSSVTSYQRMMAPPLELSSDEDIYDRLVSCVRVAADDVPGDGLKGHLDQDVYPDGDKRREISSMSTSERASTITPEILSRRWFIGHETAVRTLRVTTQSGVRNVLLPSERKVRKKAPWLKFPSIKGKIYSDQMFSQLASIHGEKGGSIFTNGLGFDAFYPWKNKGQHHEAIMSFIHEVGVPQTLVSDGAKEMIGGRSKDVCQEYRIQMKETVPYSPWQNLAEASISEFKKGTKRTSRRTGAHRRLWTYAAKWLIAFRKCTALGIPQLDGQVPAAHVGVSTPDISALAMFDFNQLVYYYSPKVAYPFEKKTIGRWIGVATNSTDDMAYTILPKSAIPITRKDVWALTEDDLKNPVIMAEIAAYDEEILLHLGPNDSTNEATSNEFPQPDLDWDENDDVQLPYDSEAESLEADDYTPEAMDEYLTAEITLPLGGEQVLAKVTGRKKDEDGKPLGKRNQNPMLDSRMYDVEFPDGSTDSFTANIIAENLYAQIDQEGRSYSILKEIMGHRKSEHAVSKDDGTITTKTGQSRKRQTTIGWELEVLWSDTSTSWIPLKDLKDSNPIETAKYAVANKIEEEPAFVWWVRTFLRQRDRIIKKVKSRYWKRTHKYGIQLPHSVEEALDIDRNSGTTFWRDSLEKEMKNNRPAFEFRDDDEVPVGVQEDWLSHDL